MHFERQRDGSYVVTSPDLPAFLTEGATLDETVASLGGALALALEWQYNREEILSTVKADR